MNSRMIKRLVKLLVRKFRLFFDIGNERRNEYARQMRRNFPERFRLYDKKRKAENPKKWARRSK